MKPDVKNLRACFIRRNPFSHSLQPIPDAFVLAAAQGYASRAGASCAVWERDQGYLLCDRSVRPGQAWHLVAVIQAATIH